MELTEQNKMELKIKAAMIAAQIVEKENGYEHIIKGNVFLDLSFILYDWFTNDKEKPQFELTTEKNKKVIVRESIQIEDIP